VNEAQEIELADRTRVRVKLLTVDETRDTMRDAVRQARVQVELNGQSLVLTSATYHLPVTFAGVQIDCPITKGYVGNSSEGNAWGLLKDARLRLWPAGSPLIEPGTFAYPIKQRWFASHTQMANEPTFVDGGEVPGANKIYYHYGLDSGGADVGAARTALNTPLQGLALSVDNSAASPSITGALSLAQIRERQDYAIQQNITTLRNRVNELGVSEPIVQRQGVDRINVQLPGVQNSAEVKDILGRVATLEFRLEDMQNNALEAAQLGRAPLGSKLYTHTRFGRPVLLKREVIATGDQLTNATTGNSTEGPAVNIRLDARAGENMLKTTRQNLNKRMAVVLIEKRREVTEVDGKKVTRDVTDEQVINDATIRGTFSNNFQITGLGAGEARELALLLRSGSLATSIYPIEERAVGPTLGAKNIDQGVTALIVGMAGVFLFMALYYRTFGLVADLVLLANVVLLTALLSMMRASLSLPGIAGIILTVGMAVDANVLIYERIREEIRKGVSPQAAIRAGFEKAFSAIADSNITTLIAGVVLWVFGTGPIRGFAIVLTLGIATSMFTSLMGSRALLTLMYGGRRKIARLNI
jgi:preprotein translocase subunit SecD